MKLFLHKYGHVVVNMFLLVCLGHYTIERGSNTVIEAYYLKNYEPAELAFFLHNIVMLFFIMARRHHKLIENRFSHQLVALFAFFSGMAFMESRTDSILLVRSGETVIAIAMILSTISLLNLGRSFGILIACRDIKTTGLYGVIRHPMYFMDILWRVGIILTWPSLANVIVFLLSSGAYVYRALLEERFLSGQQEYQEYMERIRYRFIPGVF